MRRTRGLASVAAGKADSSGQNLLESLAAFAAEGNQRRKQQLEEQVRVQKDF